MNREDFDMEVINTLQIFSQNLDKKKYITLITNIKFVENFVLKNSFPNDEYFQNVRNILQTVPTISVRFKSFLMFYYPSDKRESNTEQLKRILELPSDLNTEETEVDLFSPPGSSKDEDSDSESDSDSDSDSNKIFSWNEINEKVERKEAERMKAKKTTTEDLVENATSIQITSEDDSQYESTYSIPCKKGMECIYLKKGYCRYHHEPCPNVNPKGERCKNINNTDTNSRCGYYHIICKDYTEENGWKCPRGNSCNFRHFVPFSS